MASCDLTVHVTLDDAELQEALHRLDRDTMRAMIRTEVRAALAESRSIAPFESRDDLAAFVRAEVRKALDDLALATRMHAGIQAE